jgi:streptomycin 6-kinase
MLGFHSNSFDPKTLVVLEAAFDEAWLTLKAAGNTTVRPDELARSLLRLAMDGERDPVRLHDGALKGLLPAAVWREAS